MLGLYVHIPFCNSICSYCDFPKMMAKSSSKSKYIDHLINELDSYKNQLTNVHTVYIGGGTPNSLDIGDFEKLLKALKPYLDVSVENTIEINSEIFTEEQAMLLSKYNINRVSIGVQTINSNLLQYIRRNHTKEDVDRTIFFLKKYNISNINVDMMYGLPHQSIEELEEDLNYILALNISHVSYYSLILEEKTILEYEIKHNQIQIPDDDCVANMANYITQKMDMSMFKQYEISNYAKEGYQSKHNLLYWNTEEYIGIGAGACGYINNIRYQNNKVLNRYYKNYIEFEEYISIEESKSEYMMLGLRKIEGINIDDYYNKYKTYPNYDFDIDKLINMGLIEVVNNFIRIKKDKILLGNLVFQEFVR